MYLPLKLCIDDWFEQTEDNQFIVSMNKYISSHLFKEKILRVMCSNNFYVTPTLWICAAM